MKKESIANQLDIYEEGLSSLEEEEKLASLLGESNDGVNAWFKYIQQQKKVAPQNLESDIWALIQKRESRKRRILLRVASVAASIILGVSVFLTIQTRPQEKMSYAEKAAVFEEALAMISDTQEQPILGEILYEDEILIIYIK